MSKPKELIGQKFGKLIVIEMLPSYKWRDPKTNKLMSRRQWKCLCDCGRTVKASSNQLTRSKQKVSGCKSCSYASRPQSTRRLSSIERIFNLRIKRNAEQKGLEVKITPEEFFNKAKLNCYYCNSEAKEVEIYKNKYAKSEKIYINGLDRIDSNKGYTQENTVSCCKHCNTAKNALDQDKFKEWVINIYNFWAKEKS